MTGSLEEELALERMAVAELAAESNALWQTGHFALARDAKERMREAQQHIAELERRLHDGEH